MTAALERDPQLLGGGTFSSPSFAGNRSDVAGMFITLSHHQLAHSQFSIAEREQILMTLPELVQRQLQAVNTFTTTEVTSHSQRCDPTFFYWSGWAR